MKIWRSGTGTVADCEGCEDLSPDASRAQVRAHVRDTGHHVVVVAELSTHYEPDERSASSVTR